ncbi:MAG TPA: SpoIIE family protein phosphatase [Bryobacteraceae bacterium]|nr:SpoIIE family protein phosphatase [Bryobacteraceae bacterium]
MPPLLNKLLATLGRLGTAFLLLLALYLALSFFAPGRALTVLIALAMYVTGFLFALQLMRRNVRRIIWRLRNRLIVAYLFIAFVPIVLIAILVAIAGYVLVGQVAVYLVSSELDRRTSALNGVAHLLAETPADKRQSTMHDVVPYLESLFPNVELLIRDHGIYHYPEGSSLVSPPAQWKDDSELIIKDARLHSWAHVTHQDTEVTIIAPITSDLLSRLAPGIGEVFLVSFGPSSARPPSQRTQKAARPPGPANSLDVNVNGYMPLYFRYWDAPERQNTWLLLVRTRPSVVLGTVFTQVNWAQGVLAIFLLVAGLLLLVWVVSFIMGVSLTRTITRAVHNLYEGTQRVKGGDFSHRIAVEGNDQLAELGRSFNGMTENLERLIVVEKEQERLKSEIEIAREVQSQLFPSSAPAMKTIELTGVCHPARMVSGDYYDFMRLGDSGLALAIGDVAGKGISAALLMAAIQSAMRTQLTAGIPVHAMAASGGGNGKAHIALSAVDLVSQLNKQVYANTSAEKYATFYFGLYDDDTRTLTYTNAGHLPPILMRDGQAERLDVTGTVVGAFPFAAYEEKSVELRRGDLLVAFTDGIVEPENEYGEAYGEDRLIDLLARYQHRESKEIIARVMETVEQWTGTSELFDDMTILVARSV